VEKTITFVVPVPVRSYEPPLGLKPSQSQNSLSLKQCQNGASLTGYSWPNQCADYAPAMPRMEKHLQTSCHPTELT